jgi:hypothetical protein
MLSSGMLALATADEEEEGEEAAFQQSSESA